MVAENSTIADRSVRIVLARAPRFDTATVASGAVLAAALGAVLFATLGSPLKDDVAWLLHIANQWLHGRRLYVDIVEVNPPLIVWLSAIPVLVGDAIGISAASV